MSIEIKPLKNKRRGTKLTYATIPIEEAKNISESEFNKYINSLGIKGEARFAEEYPHGLSDFAIIHGTREYRGGINTIINNFLDNKKEKEIVLSVTSNEDTEYVHISKSKGKIVFMPHPVIHAIEGFGGDWRNRRKELGLTPFDDLLTILNEGFVGKHCDENSVIKTSKSHRLSWGYGSTTQREGITKGDSYHLEIFPEKGSNVVYPEYVLKKAKPENILSVNIRLNPISSNKEREEKMNFYMKEVAKKYGIKVRFFELNSYHSNKDKYSYKQKRLFPNVKSLEKKVLEIVSIVGVGSSLFFLSSNLTGNVIANLSTKTISFLGIGLLIIGLIAGFLWMKIKRK